MVPAVIRNCNRPFQDLVHADPCSKDGVICESHLERLTITESFSVIDQPIGVGTCRIVLDMAMDNTLGAWRYPRF